jgi:hypothetical protein
MSVGATSGSRSGFGVVSPDLGTTKERTLVEENDLTEKEREALEADTFIIYGKASVEQYDEDNPPQKIEMKAFEEEMSSQLSDGIISRRHKDIPVGEPIESYSLDEPAEVVVGDEVIEFDAGDTLETGVQYHGDGDDELWIAADLRNDSEIARDTRMGALTGELTGFSVTVFCKEWEETSKGQRVTDIDWHSTTIGGDEHIKNKDSRFGVAEFKALFGDEFPGLTGKQAERATVEILRELPNNMSDTDDKGFWDRVRDIASEKAEDGESEPESEKSDDDEQDEDPVDEKESTGAEEEPEEEKGDGEDGDQEPEDTKGSDVDAVIERVKQELGDEEAEVLKEAVNEPPIEEPPTNKPVKDEEDEMASEAEEGELKGQKSDGESGVDPDALVEKMKDVGFVTEDHLEEKMSGVVTEDELTERVGEKLDNRLSETLPDGDVASKADVQDVVETAEEVIAETVPEAQKEAAKDAAEETAQKMSTGETPDPSNGSAKDQSDYRDQIQNRFGSESKGGN